MPRRAEDTPVELEKGPSPLEGAVTDMARRDHLQLWIKLRPSLQKSRTHMILHKSQCAGSVRLREAHVGGQLDCAETVFQTSGDWALDAYGLVVEAYSATACR
jgi:hypothetical protein